jgi:hypothetical protein
MALGCALLLCVGTSLLCLSSPGRAATAHGRAATAHGRAARARASDAGTSSIRLGINIDGSPDTSALASYTSLAGAPPSIVMWYQQWSEPLFYPKQLSDVASVGATPMVTWDPTINGAGIPFADISNGTYDTYIRNAALAAKAWGKPLYLRFAHEMNLSDSPFGPGQDGNTAAGFVGAWRHVVSVFRDAGADNVQWVWSPNVDCAGRCPFTSFYPGDAWVDWVALDGYNYSSTDHEPWKSIDQIFGPSYATLSAMTNKPMMIAETASAEQGGNKAAWITEAFLHEIPNELPRVRAVVWFDRVKETDWRVDSSASALSAWRKVVASPIYGGTAASSSAQSPRRR